MLHVSLFGSIWHNNVFIYLNIYLINAHLPNQRSEGAGTTLNICSLLFPKCLYIA